MTDYHPEHTGHTLDELLDTMSGQVMVTTEHSVYVLDMDARTLLRLPDAGDASDLRRDGQTVDLLRVGLCMVGEPAVWTIDLHVPGVPYTTRRSTPVASIRRLTTSGHD